MTLKIIHIVTDDKFADAAYDIFESQYPNQNEFIIFSDSDKLHYIKKIKPQFHKRINIFFKISIKKILQADLVIFHGYNSYSSLLLRAIPRNTPTIWIGFGFDYYDLINRPLYKKKTKLIANGFSRKQTLLSLPKKIFKQLVQKYLNKKRLINKFDIFSPVLEQEYYLVQKNLKVFLPKFASWNYGTLEDHLVKEFVNLSICGNNILLGNSATLSNNHVEAFDLINALNIDDRNIITPLSYGDSNYADLIIEKGYNIFGNCFSPLTDFVELASYIKILQSCSIVIMNHLRQQALGNIVISLYLGAKVFLDDRNPIYIFFLEKKAFIYSLSELENELNSELTNEQILRNREILREHWGRESIYAKTRNLVGLALERDFNKLG